ncbi:hypothetical protein HU200_038068 [Digitaria exilis]|uniref:Uncharacterized protein n=1 Tax=Digitaria exilis TaxID=1010633 RepID=A0A835EJR9_9POAL|nr:hypothetical protein HU200_038068 [Digitaria exilis]
MASASRALLLARFRTLPAYGVVRRPLAAAGSLLLLLAGPCLFPAVAPVSTAKAAVMCFATRWATSSSLLSSSRPHKETVAIGDAMGSDSDGDSEEMSSEDERSNDEDTSSFSDDVEKKTSDDGVSSPPKETVAFDDGCDFKHWLIRRHSGPTAR